MRLVRLSLLLAALLAPIFTASIASAQEKNQKATTAQTPSRTGQVQADDIIDRMSKAERAVLERLKTSHPLMEVYIQNVAPDEARGWVPTDDNYFLGQLHFDELHEFIGGIKPTGRGADAGRQVLKEIRGRVELLLFAANFNFIGFSRYLGDINGQVFVFFILTVAAAEAAIGLGILVVLFRERRTIDVEDLNTLKG